MFLPPNLLTDSLLALPVLGALLFGSLWAFRTRALRPTVRTYAAIGFGLLAFNLGIWLLIDLIVFSVWGTRPTQVSVALATIRPIATMLVRVAGWCSLIAAISLQFAPTQQP